MSNSRLVAPRFKRFNSCPALFFATFLAAATATASVPESDSSIRIIVNNWTSQIVLSNILGAVYLKMGYAVEFVELETDVQWGHLHRGMEHVQVEVWEGTMGNDFERVSKFGNMIDAGTYDAVTREEWWYPLYVEESCPGLPDWRALRRCAPIFASDDTSQRGRYLTGPWEKPENARVRALGLDFEVIAVERAADLWVELEEAFSEKRPIILFNWTPNSIEAQYQGRFVEFPTYEPECETDPEWGINNDWAYDCGNPKDGWLKKAAWAGMENTWPCALGMLRSMNLNNAIIAQVAAMVDFDDMSHQLAAQQWLAENTDLWRSWIPDRCR